MFGGAIATADGIRRVLLRVGAAPDAPPVNGRQVGTENREQNGKGEREAIGLGL